MSGNIIWGLLLVLLGLSIISKTLFGFAIPFFRITIALMIIYFGITMLFDCGESFKCPFGYKKTKIKHLRSNGSKYSVIFSESTIDLSDATLTEKPAFVEISTVFGNTKLLLDPAIPTKISVSNVFSRTTFPDDTEFSVMGDQSMLFGPQETEPVLIIHANVVFGSLSIKKK